MRYMTPDTPGKRSLEESLVTKGTMAKGAEATPTGQHLSNMKTTTPSATPTPTPSPTKVPQPAAITTKKPSRRAIRTYGKKRSLSDEANEQQASKRPKTDTAMLVAVPGAVAVAAPATAPPPVRRDSIADEVSRQLQKEADEAESRNNSSSRRPQTPLKATNPKTSSRKAASPQRAASPRRVGIMRYFQPAARSAPAPRRAPPPPSLPEPSSPAASISSMSSLSSCPSPASSIASFRSTATSVVSSPSAKSSYFVDDAAFAAVVDPDSPPSSPLWNAFDQRPRQKRRLTIRPDQQMATAAKKTGEVALPADNGNENENDVKKQSEQVEEPDEETKENRPFASSMMAASSTRMRIRLGLSSTGTSAAITSRKRKMTPGAPSVQTTLSLAIASRHGGSTDSASVRECKECNILYNPLHEKDAKFHARYHASVCRKQQKEQSGHDHW